MDVAGLDEDVTLARGGRSCAGGHPLRRWNLASELLVVFVIGVALMQYLYSATPDAARGLPAALPGNDDFYHLKMALLLPKIGLPDRLDWLQHTIFADRFVSHHYGFHVYLQPFVHLFSDPVIGARWAMSVSFGLVLGCVMLLLMLEGVGHRWLWLTLMLLLPDDFYVRHTYVRAIDLSLLCLLLGMMCLFRRRYVLLAGVLVLYTHIYLGSFFLIVIAGIHWIGQRLGARELDWPDRRLARKAAGCRPASPEEAGQRPAPPEAGHRPAPPLGPAPRIPGVIRLPLLVLVGAGVGLLTHPYGRGAIGFLRTQIFGSGLTPQVSVGREWNPYENVWDFAMRMGVPMTALAVGIALRLLRGRRLRTSEWTTLLTALFFFALTLKARRFVEYFPMFAVLATAMLASPVLGAGMPAVARRGAGADPVISGVKLLLGGWGVYASWQYFRADQDRIWFIGAAVLIALYLLVVIELPILLSRRRGVLALAGNAALAVAILGVLALSAHPVQRRVRSWCEGNYDLPAIQRVMEFVKEQSQPGDIVFADDWDIFPVYFYFNDKNRYVAGLDPMFSYERDPELWERYKLLTRGQAPLTTNVKLPRRDEQGRVEMIEQKITVPLEDIRNRYHARFIVVDSDHQPFARKLDAARGFARRIYPPVFDRATKPPYSVYEVLAENSPVERQDAVVTEP
ncbi:MAG: hypothetical protein IT449_03955 [Phycisphaerales bacterium]|nr:hypothetical protein [Phycisphaerales bacterium]